MRLNAWGADSHKINLCGYDISVLLEKPRYAGNGRLVDELVALAVENHHLNTACR